jgi:inorganic pyrophosphatase/exopolyphosphatase
MGSIGIVSKKFKVGDNEVQTSSVAFLDRERLASTVVSDSTAMVSELDMQCKTNAYWVFFLYTKKTRN